MTAPIDDRDGIHQTIRALLAAGYTLREVFDGEEDVTVHTEDEAVKAIMAVDDATLWVVRGPGEGWVRFVMGNEPYEVICDHTVNLEPVIGKFTDPKGPWADA